MNVRTVKKPLRRIDTSYVSRFNLQSYGHDNLYPQNLRDITSCSGTAELCLERYAKFIEGYGFMANGVAEIVVNRRGDTLDDILRLVAADMARYGGFALHVNYNALCQVSDVSFVPFENVRLEEPDDAGNVAHVVLHPDWTGRSTRNGHQLQVNERNIRRLPVFDPLPTVVARQIEAVGGIANYSGQVLWVSKDGPTTYPRPIYDAIISDISTDEGLGNIKCRNVRNNFLTACMIIAKKGVPRVDEYDDAEDNSMISEEDLRTFQGDENSSKIMYVELENDEERPEVVSFPTANYDKDFSVTDASVIERIYAQFHQELFYSIRIGKLGFSGQVMQDAYAYYAGEVTTEQRIIERAFEKIFAHWHEQTDDNISFTVQPLKYINAETTTNSTVDYE